MDELSRILFWVMRIGPKEKSLVELSRNAKKAREAVELLQKYSLVRVRRKGRMFLVSLSEKGFAVYRKALELHDLVGLAAREEQPEGEEGPGPEAETAREGSGAVPSFIADNPWLAVLAKRGRERLGL